MALELLYFPFMVVFFLLVAAVIILVTAFWIWMIIDCVKRNFKNENEKIVWILVIVLASWIGALVYYLAVRISNPHGISHTSTKRSRR